MFANGWAWELGRFWLEKEFGTEVGKETVEAENVVMH